jgi:hypothetical protein
VRERLNVHHHGNLKLGGDIVDAPHLGRVQRHVELQFADADGASLDCLAKHLIRTRLGRIGRHGAREMSGTPLHLGFRAILVGRASQKHSVSDAAALHVCEARVRVRAQV